MNKLVIHSAGGCGISIISKLAVSLNEKIDGLCNIVYHCVDTSDKNYKYVADKFPEKCFFKIQPKKLSSEFIDGSGGDRSLNSDSIVESVKKYMDENSYLNKVKGELHLVISSTSGGSGSVIGAMIAKSLLEKNIPVLVVSIADENSVAAIEHTIKTVKTLDNIAVKAGKPLPVFYENNCKGNCALDIAYESVETSILMLIQALRVFNGDIKDIDFQDIVSLLSPTNKDFNLKPSIYNLSINLGDLDLDGVVKPLSVRMVKLEEKTTLPLNLFQFKLGEITNTTLKAFAEQMFEQNLSLVLGVGGFKPELELLAEKLVNLKRKMEISHLYLDENNESDENGLVF